MIQQPPWKDIFRLFSEKGMANEMEKYFCQAGLAFVDHVANGKRMKDIEHNGIAESNSMQVWVQNVLTEFDIDGNDYLEVKRLVNAWHSS